MKPFFAGQKTGRLTATGRWRSRHQKCRMWEFACDCGAMHWANGSEVRSGKIVSCGCKRREVLASAGWKHGGNGTREFEIWRGMLKRCYQPNCRAYKDYGGRGITVCDLWRNDFAAFLADMGPVPSGASIDRTDNNAGYGPDNCRWVSGSAQNNNTRRNLVVSLGGIRMTLKQACSAVGIPYARTRDRISLLGWPVQRAFVEPSHAAV